MTLLNCWLLSTNVHSPAPMNQPSPKLVGSGYQLTKAFYAELTANEEMQLNAKSHHLSLYTWICELRNRVSMEVVDLPRDYTMKMALIGSPSTLKACIADLAKWDIIEIMKPGKNNWTGSTKVKLSGSFLNRHCTATVQQLPSSGSEMNNNCTATVQQLYTIKTNKTDKTKKTISDADASGEPDLFEQFYDLYGKKFDRKKAAAKFNRLSRADQLAILEHVPLYVKSTPNPEYRKNPLTYLNGECWKDPIDLSKSAGTTTSQQPTAKRPSAPGQVR
ncbi:hypothetical protein M0L20_14840 [Spirosoma sp. RP8]|uniref:DUF1376 domain-containing protein n=1 Tax=Spirosoma liriopis TaxID=2937440 RepID=A0ABT0HLU3_9BACT|nr:hypothetical protein [Spirosoma liriopis]MCK8493144.1 hypothetical protein [Spirosoma liriopis]